MPHRTPVLPTGELDRTEDGRGERPRRQGRGSLTNPLRWRCFRRHRRRVLPAVEVRTRAKSTKGGETRTEKTTLADKKGCSFFLGVLHPLLCGGLCHGLPHEATVGAARGRPASTGGELCGCAHRICFRSEPRHQAPHASLQPPPRWNSGGSNGAGTGARSAGRRPVSAGQG